MTISRGAFIGSLVLMLATLIISYLFQSREIPAAIGMADGFKTPILAFEFARSLSDLAFIQGDQASELRAHFTYTQMLDQYFPIAYAGMAALFFLAVAKTGRSIAWVGLVIAVLTIPADWLENSVISAILENGGHPSSENLSSLIELQIFTWIKWFLIAGYAAVMAFLLMGDNKRLLALPSALAAVSIVATWFSGSSGDIAEVIMVSMLPFMLSFPVATVIYMRELRSVPE